jgi:hypothetical protein
MSSGWPSRSNIEYRPAAAAAAGSASQPVGTRPGPQRVLDEEERCFDVDCEQRVEPAGRL